MANEGNPVEPESPERKGRGEFFAIDYRAWQIVCSLGMNAAVAYLVIAQGTGGDNRTSSWSANAIAKYTGISRHGATKAILTLQGAGALRNTGTSTRPRYKIAPAHEMPDCDDFPPPALKPWQLKTYAALTSEWTTPESGELDEWGTEDPIEDAEELVRLGWALAETDDDGERWFKARPRDPEREAKPQWIWLPNALVTGVCGALPPVERVRQSGCVLTLRMLVNLYHEHNLMAGGGIHFRLLSTRYERFHVASQGGYVVWGFRPGKQPYAGLSNSAFASPHFPKGASNEQNAAQTETFWKCWDRLRSMGLVQFIEHLVEGTTDEAEIICPVALTDAGLPAEQEVAAECFEASKWVATPDQRLKAKRNGAIFMAPVQRHIENVQMVGVARLRYRPRTRQTQEFVGRGVEWRAVVDRLRQLKPDPVVHTRRGKVRPLRTTLEETGWTSGGRDRRGYDA